MAIAARDQGADVIAYMNDLGLRARAAARLIARADSGSKNAALQAIADTIEANADALARANGKDLDAGRANKLSSALLDRLELTPARITAMATGLRQIALLADPVGEITGLNKRPSGIEVGRMRVPLGVIGIIYESRPNVTADAAALCLKSGNATILRGGSEAIHSNTAIAQCIHQGLASAGLPADVVQVVNTTDRAAVGALITMNESVDIIVPRGGKGLIERVAAQATVPVIKHLDGVCHVYVDRGADLDKACAIALNAKTYRYGICGAMETLLVDSTVAADFLPRIAALFRSKGVEMRGCAATCAILSDAKAATSADWFEEYLAPIIAIRVLDGIDAAMTHIREYGSAHTDAIVTTAAGLAGSPCRRRSLPKPSAILRRSCAALSCRS